MTVSKKREMNFTRRQAFFTPECLSLALRRPPLATVVLLSPLRQVEAVGVSTGQTSTLQSDHVARLKQRGEKKKKRTLTLEGFPSVDRQS